MPSHSAPIGASRFSAAGRASLFGALCAVLAGPFAAVALSPNAARACSPAQPQWEARPWSRQQEDGQGPTGAPVISGSARAPEATKGCGRDDDLGSDPGDCSTLGSVKIYLEEPATDDLTSEVDMAYRVEILEGDQVFPTDKPIYAEHGAGDSAHISSRISQAKLRTRLRVIPVDAAGNEGPPSNMITISFDESGRCTLLSDRPATLLPTACLLLWLSVRCRRRTNQRQPA